VSRELTARGLSLQPQVGVSGYRIDFGVVDASVPGRFVCGIECDGVAYHAAQTARDRDRLRQQVLEGRGWEIHRIWSTDWFKDRAAQIERIVRLVAESSSRAMEHARMRDEPTAVAETSGSSKLSSRVGVGDVPAEYVRPRFAPYRFAELPVQVGELLDVPRSRIAKLIDAVIETEGPLHVDDLFERVKTAFGKARVGANIRARLEEGLGSLIADGKALRREDFVWKQGQIGVPRDRSGMRTAAERIAPEEYRQALVTILRATNTLTKSELFDEVRDGMGLGRSRGAVQRLERALNELLASGEAGESSTGIGLRA
jgi:very-short-patch-repair endonuclease